MMPVRYLLCGKAPGHLQACKDVSQPDFEVLKTASTVKDAKSAALDLLQGNERKISFIAMGGGFSNDDMEEIYSVANSVPWFRPVQTKPTYSGPPSKGPPAAAEVASRLRRALDEHKSELEAGKGAGQVWYF